MSMKITGHFDGPINGCNPVWIPAVDRLAYLLLFKIIQISVAIMRGQSIRLCDVTTFVFPYNDGVKKLRAISVEVIVAIYCCYWLFDDEYRL